MIWDWIISQPFEVYGAIFTVLCFFVNNVINNYIGSYVENINELSEDADEDTSVQIKTSDRPHRMLDI
jgi:hypothetical protein